MPELHHILGSLFSDIAQSVFTSDLYSRDISRYYEQDGLLRHFPVPRTEIAELEVDLKFAIAKIELNPAQTVSRQANAATVFMDFSYTLSESFYEALHEKLLELRKQGRPISNAMLEQAASEVNTIYLRQDLLRLFQRQQGDLIEDGNFQVEEARREVLGVLRKHLHDLSDKEDILTWISKTINLEADLKDMVEPLRFAWNRAGDFEMDVQISAEELSQLDSEHLSSVHVRTRVRNYKWSEVEHEGRRWWRLNPE